MSRVPHDLFEQLFHHATIGIIIYELEDATDPTSLTILAVNENAKTATQANLDAVVGMNIMEAFPNITNTELLDAFSKAVQEQTTQTVPHVIYGDDQIPAGVFSVDAVPLGEGYLAALFTNITKRIQDETALKDKVKECNDLNKSMVGRELTMIEMRRRIAELEGRPMPKHFEEQES